MTGSQPQLLDYTAGRVNPVLVDSREEVAPDPALYEDYRAAKSKEAFSARRGLIR